MKEATGELNVTVIVVISVGILSAFFFSVIWPMINDNFEANSRCSDAICVCEDIDECVRTGTVDGCYIAGNKDNTFTCDYKG